MSLIDLKQTKKEVKSSGEVAPSSISEDHPMYPWGLEVNLEEESLEKLKMSAGNFKIGQKLKMVCEVEITRISQNQSMKKKRESVNLQIQKMSLAAGGNKGLDWDSSPDKAEKELHKRGHI